MWYIFVGFLTGCLVCIPIFRASRNDSRWWSLYFIHAVICWTAAFLLWPLLFVFYLFLAIEKATIWHASMMRSVLFTEQNQNK